MNKFKATFFLSVMFKSRQNKISLALITLVTVVILSIFILLFTLSLNFKNISVSIVCDYVTSNLNEISHSADFMNDTAKNMANQIYNFDNDTKFLMYDSSLNSQEIYFLLKKLSFYKSSINYINSIYIYNGNMDKVFYSNQYGEGSSDLNSFYDKDILNQLINKQQLSVLAPIPRIISDSPLISSNIKVTDSPVYSYLLYNKNNSLKKLESSVIINIDEEYLKQLIGTISNNSTNEIIIIDKNGESVFNKANSQTLNNIKNNDFTSKILNSKKINGYYITTVNGKRSVVTYATSNVLNWIFIMITPYSQIEDRIQNVLYSTLFIGILILFLGVIISSIISKNIFNSVKKILIEMTLLKDEKTFNSSYLKQKYLQDLITNISVLDASTISQKFKDFGIKIDPNQSYVILLLKIDHFVEFCEKYSSSDRSLNKYEIMRIVSEVFSSTFKTETVELTQDSVSVIINVSQTYSHQHNQVLDKLIEQSRQRIFAFINLSFSVIISSVGTSISSIGIVNQECLNNSYYRLILGHSCTIYPDTLQILNNSSFEYPDEKEKMFNNSLLLCRISEAKETFCSILDLALKYSHTVINSTILRLALSINITIEIIEKNNGFSLMYNFNSFILNMNSFETIDELKIYFFQLFDNISTCYSNKKNVKLESVIDRAVEIINKKYSDLNLSIDLISDDIGISTSYLRRLFKQFTGVSVSEYILGIRVEKAKDMLLMTKYSINDISIRTGFVNNSYFYTIFKKYNGITPSEFREKAADTGLRIDIKSTLNSL